MSARDEGNVVHVVPAGLCPPTAPPGVPDQPAGPVSRRSPVRIHHDEAVRLRKAVEVRVLLELGAGAQASMERDQERHGAVGQGTRDVEVVGTGGAVHREAGIDPSAPRRDRGARRCASRDVGLYVGAPAHDRGRARGDTHGRCGPDDEGHHRDHHGRPPEAPQSDMARESHACIVERPCEESGGPDVREV